MTYVWYNITTYKWRQSMENKSRLRKYESLRNSINLEEEAGSETSRTADTFIQKQNDAKISEDTYKPERETVDFYKDIKSSVSPRDDERFTNEYLDDFVKEIREYNMAKGNRDLENTQADILFQLNEKRHRNRSMYINKIEEQNDNEQNNEKEVEGQMSNEDIAQQVHSLLNEKDDDLTSVFSPIFGEEIKDELIIDENLHEEENVEASASAINENEEEKEEEVFEEVAPAESYNTEFIEDSALNVKSDNAVSDRERIEDTLYETQQLKTQLDNCEDKISNLNESVGSTNKLLSWFLGFLIIALLVLFGYIAYMIYNIGGTQ